MTMLSKVKRLSMQCFPALMPKLQFFRRLGYWPNLKHPRTLNEKLFWLKLFRYAEHPLVAQCADKYRVRRYVEQKGCAAYLNRLLGVWQAAGEIDWEALPAQFVLKCNHGCGFNILCSDKAQLDRTAAVRRLEDWMSTDFGTDSLEPHYDRIPKRILCEAYLEAPEGGPLVDYKIHCCNGRPRVVLVCTGRGDHLRKTFLDLSWKPLAVGAEPGQPGIARPDSWTEMLRVARTLSEGFPFVRVDFYEARGRPVFGEMTFTPARGASRAYSRHGDLALGRLLEIQESKP